MHEVRAWAGLVADGPLGDAVLVALVPTVEALRRGAEAAGVQRQAIDVEAVDVVLPMGPAWVAMWCAGWRAVRGPARVRYVRYKHTRSWGLAGPRGTHRHLPCHEWHSVVAAGRSAATRPRGHLAVAPGDPAQLALDALDGHRRLLPSRLARAIPSSGLSYELFAARNEA